MKAAWVVTVCGLLAACGGGGGDESGPAGGGGAKTPAWSFDTGAEVAEVAISADGSRVLVAGNGKIWLLSGATGQPIWTYTDPDDNLMDGASLSSTGTSGVVTAGGKIFSVGSGGVRWTATTVPVPGGGFAGVGSPAAVSADGTSIVGANPHGLRYPASTATPTWHNVDCWGSAVAVSGNGGVVAVDDHYAGKVFVLNGATGATIGSSPHGGLVDSIAISQNGSTVAAASHEVGGGIYAVNGATGAALWSSNVARAGSVAVSADGNKIAGAFYDSKVRLYARSSSTPLWTYPQGGGAIYSVAISADGTTVAAGGDWGAVSLVSAATGAALWEYRPGTNDAYNVAISADGGEVAVGMMGEVLLFRR